MMIAIMQVTDIIYRVIAFVRSLFERIFNAFRGLFQFQNLMPEDTTTQEQIAEIAETTTEIVESAENTTLIYGLFAFIGIILFCFIIFFIIYLQSSYEFDQKAEVLKNNFSIVEGRGNDQKIDKNENTEGDKNEKGP